MRYDTSNKNSSNSNQNENERMEKTATALTHQLHEGREHEMRKERYIHDESYIEVLTATKAVVVGIFHAHVFDFT